MLDKNTFIDILKGKGYTITSAAEKIGKTKQSVSLAFKAPPEIVGLPEVRERLAKLVFEMPYNVLWGNSSKNGKI